MSRRLSVYRPSDGYALRALGVQVSFCSNLCRACRCFDVADAIHASRGQGSMVVSLQLDPRQWRGLLTARMPPLVHPWLARSKFVRSLHSLTLQPQNLPKMSLTEAPASQCHPTDVGGDGVDERVFLEVTAFHSVSLAGENAP